VTAGVVLNLPLGRRPREKDWISAGDIGWHHRCQLHRGSGKNASVLMALPVQLSFCPPVLFCPGHLQILSVIKCSWLSH